MNVVTIFTPTFNRAYLLSDLYESLLRQSNRGFEWLIVDDGSSDDTAELVANWINDGEILIRYYKQENQGKHIAHNKGVELCHTPLFFCVDSDDRLPREAVQFIYDLYEEEKGKRILGFYMRKSDFSGHTQGMNWPHHVQYATLNELYQKYRYRGEAAIILFTEAIKPYSFPQFAGEKFVTETVFYDQISAIAPMRLDNRICYLFEYKRDGYTLQGMRLQFNNPVGTGYNFLHHIGYMSGFLKKCKTMGQFLAWTEMFAIDEPLYKTIQTPMYVKFFGHILKSHYLKLFIRHRGALSNEA
ncbi:glycosyltransferase family A protein [Desulfitobacterium sp. THU1]|uniref:glycosyltransferase family A protein n=1 Tax=Desulfitobacterium sp. THU1 TaxID=3138072 RepID=UPI00311E3C73